ncbi:ubiquitin carboxyl-terminal hydrolase 21-like isoform X2 [Asparagus officinalis]|uniref:ubiquitin carboxyl-terminal hydrolase 21-like isoform X2 n=1 Tax=Asparagus officinalis TaxID=4686 RepID=UPI00098E3735|nr:ubiquitin carboxyl-terminal hydrolase 21-like isoform X2 [Asparagus officinalis]
MMKRLDFYMTKGYRFIGASLKNMGNSCYVNAVLQCLTHTVPLVEALRSSDHSSLCSRGADEFCSFCILKKHVDYCLRASGFSITPKLFVNNLSKISSDFEPGQQQDAHEFLCCLLDKLHQSFNSEHSPISQIFGGHIKSQVCCCNCAHVTDTYESMIDLSLEIDNAETFTLIDALESFTKVETLDDPDNKFSCEACQDKVFVEKQIKLFEAPQVLSINFKRFKVCSSGIYKIDKFVEYPLQLDLRPFLSSPENEVFRYPQYLALNRSAYILFYIKQGSAPWFMSVLERVLRTSVEDIDATKISEKENDQTTTKAEDTTKASDHYPRPKEGSKDQENSHKNIEKESQNDEDTSNTRKRGRVQYENEPVSP